MNKKMNNKEIGFMEKISQQWKKISKEIKEDKELKDRIQRKSNY